MDCPDLIAHFSEYLDGSAPSGEVRAVEEHLAACALCRRYRDVLEQGASLVKSLPRAELREDFGPRLQHRLYHVEEGRLDQTMSGAPALTVLGIAVLLAAVAWAPLLRGSAPVVELAPIVVDRAPPRLPTIPGGAIRSQVRTREASDELDVDLWDDARLYEYSRLNRRYQGDAQPRQVGYAPQP
jgi:anti-sigma factor RsiW